MEMETDKGTVKSRGSGTDDIGTVIQKIKSTVLYGAPGRDYTIANRDKYKILKQHYVLTDNKVKQILQDLGNTDFIKKEKSNHAGHLQDTVYIFKKEVLLMPRFQENAEYQKTMIYIKLTWPVTDTEGKMFIISFHEDER